MLGKNCNLAAQSSEAIRLQRFGESVWIGSVYNSGGSWTYGGDQVNV